MAVLGQPLDGMLNSNVLSRKLGALRTLSAYADKNNALKGKLEEQVGKMLTGKVEKSQRRMTIRLTVKHNAMQEYLYTQHSAFSAFRVCLSESASLQAVLEVIGVICADG